MNNKPLKVKAIAALKNVMHHCRSWLPRPDTEKYWAGVGQRRNWLFSSLADEAPLVVLRAGVEGMGKTATVALTAAKARKLANELLSLADHADAAYDAWLEWHSDDKGNYVERS